MSSCKAASIILGIMICFTLVGKSHSSDEVKLSDAEKVVHTGFASYFSRPYHTTECIIEEEVPEVMVAAASVTLYEGGKHCGKQQLIQCIGSGGENGPCKHNCEFPIVIAKLCNDCGYLDFRLSKDAFDKIANFPVSGDNISIRHRRYVPGLP